MPEAKLKETIDFTFYFRLFILTINSLYIQAKMTDDDDEENTGMLGMLSEFKQALAVKKPETGRVKHNN